MRAEIIAIGSELLTPSRLDTNSLFITERLNSLGITLMRKCVVGDRAEEIREAFTAALEKSEIVVLIGGLGPTRDDITREVVAETLGHNITEDPSIVKALKKRYKQTGLKMTDNNRRQAMVVEGAQLMENPFGTAPGLFLMEGNSLIFLLPGPPSELKPMVSNHVLPLISRHKPVHRSYCRQLKIGSELESRIDHLVGSIYESYSHIETTILAAPGLIELYFYWRGKADGDIANRQLDELTQRIREKLGVSVFTDKEESLEAVVGQLLRSRRRTLATAESCTGGAIGKLLTDVPGSSDYYKGGVVCYSNELKIQLLGVNETTLERVGAVSEPVAEQMAVGIRKRTASDIGLSVTGIAGPEGGTTEKPVGLIFVGLAMSDGNEVRKLLLRGDRETIRMRSSRIAIDWLRRKLL